MRITLAGCLLLLLATPGSAQDCALPPVAPHGTNIFSEEQENYLGDASAEQFEREYRVVTGPLNDNLQAIGRRLLANAPPSQFKFRFVLMDVPTVNAWALPGGRIYVTRKLVAATRNEDELAGVLGHEMSHVYFRHSAIDFTERLRIVLRVNRLGDRADVYARYHQLRENWGRKASKLSYNIAKEQDEADRFGIFLAAKAGYRPDAHAEFWDHFYEVKGETGNWFSDLFGTTKPESKRLRELLRTSQPLLRSCATAKASVADYARWQSDVVAYSPEAREGELPGLVWKREVKPPLRTVISYLHYSGDGRYILAQDDFSIFVLQREPLTFLFRIDARDAFRPHFTPDNQGIVFHTAGLRVERWDIASKKRLDVREIFTPGDCNDSEVSPTGELFACFELPTLRLLTVKDSQPVFESKDFYQLTYGEYFTILLARLLDLDSPIHLMNLGFSPDGRYFAAGRHNTTLAYDTVARKQISIPGSVRSLLGRSFEFQSQDRLVGVNWANPGKSGIVRFPDGQKISQFKLGSQSVLASSQPDVIFLKPIKDWALGVLDVPSGKIVMGNKTGALDVYQNVYVSERLSGEIVLFDRAKGEEGSLAQLELPLGPLGTLRSFAVSDDFRYLAISGRTRGGVYDLETGERLAHVRGFRGAHFSDDNVYMDFPKLEEQKRQVARFDLDSKEFAGAVPVGEGRVYKHGRFVLDYKPKKEGGDSDRDTMLVVADADSMNILWKKQFPKETPDHYVSGSEDIVVFTWRLNTGAAKAELASDPEVERRAKLIGRKEDNYLLEVVDLADGRVLGKVVVDTGKGSFRIEDVDANDEYLLLSDRSNRVLLYSLKTGDVVERYFGDRVNVSRAAGVFSIQTAEGKLSLYDLATRQRIREYSFAEGIRSTFGRDGKRLFVLSESQQAYLLDMPARGASSK
jgi:hypothetical protein